MFHHRASDSEGRAQSSESTGQEGATDPPNSNLTLTPNGTLKAIKLIGQQNSFELNFEHNIKSILYT